MEKILFHKKKLLDCLRVVDFLISTDWKDCNKDNAAKQFGDLKQSLKDANIDTAHVEKALLDCDCLGKSLYCILSTVANSCCLFIYELISVCEKNREFSNCDPNLDFSVQEKRYLSHILDFIILNGLIRHLDFSLTILFPQTESNCVGLKRTLFGCCKYLFEMGEKSNVKDLVFPKHLLPLFGAFVQLSYSPNSLKMLSSDELSISKACLSKLVANWSPLQDIVKCLFVIQGSASRKAPLWLQNACGSLLSKCLLQKHGVCAVISALLTTFGEEMTSWKKADVAAGLLATVPHTAAKESYYVNICDQIITLLQSPQVDKSENDSEKVFLQILTATLLNLYQKNPDLAKKYFFNKVFRSFRGVYSDFKVNLKNGENKLLGISTAIDILHKIFVLHKHPHKELAIKTLLIPHFHGLFALFNWSRNSISHVQSLLRQLIIKSLKAYNSAISISILMSFCGIREKAHAKVLDTIYSVNVGVKFSLDDNEEIIVSKQDILSRSPEDIMDAQNMKVRSVIDMMTMKEIDKFPARVFIAMLKHIEDLSNDSTFVEKPNQLLTDDEKAVLHLQSGESRLLAYALLTALSEKYDPRELFSDVNEVTAFAQVFLERACRPYHDLEVASIIDDSLKLCFALLGMCLVIPIDGNERGAFNTIVPLLQKLSKATHLPKEDRITASELAKAIATHGAYSNVPFDLYSKDLKNQVKGREGKIGQQTKQSSKFTSSNGTASHKRPVKTAGKPSVKNSTLKTSHSNQSANTASVTLSTVKGAISSLYDPCPSNRAAGFRYLSVAIKVDADEVKNNLAKLTDVIMEVLLKENDSFVYLSAIQAMVDAVNKAPLTGDNSSNLFDQLLKEYEKFIRTEGSEAEEKAVKVGEILIRLVAKLGDLADYQSSKLLPVLFRGSRDKRPPIRSSCISNLAELCPMLRHSLSKFKYELTDCVCATATSDNNVSVRRAAVHVVRKLIEVLGPDMLQIFSDSMRRFYSVMKHIYQNDADHVVQLHAQLALEALDEFMRDFMFNDVERKNKSLKKKITVLPQ